MEVYGLQKKVKIAFAVFSRERILFEENKKNRFVTA